MAIAEELQVVITAKGQAAVRDLKKVDTQMDKTEKSAKSMAKAFLKTGTAAAAVAFSVRAIVKVLKDSIVAFRGQELAENSLNASIIATGQEMEISLASMKEYASGLQQVTLFGDETILSSQALLQSLASLNEEGLKVITPAVLDFATATGMDLNAAMSLVGKTIGSSTNALARYGIEIDATASKEDKLAQLTEELQNKFGGMAEAAGDTASGKLTQLSNTMGDLQEVLGESVVGGLQPFTTALNGIVSGFVGWITKAREARDIIEDIEDGGAGSATNINDLNTALADQQEQYDRLIQLYHGISAAEILAIEGLSKEEAAIIERNGALKEAIAILRDASEAEFRSVEFVANHTAEIQAAQKALDDLHAAETEHQSDLEYLNELYTKTDESQIAVLQSQIAMLESWKDGPKTAAVIEMLNDQLVALIGSTEELVGDTEDLSEQTWVFASAQYELVNALNSGEEALNMYNETALTVVSTLGTMSEVFGSTLVSAKSFWEATVEATKSGVATVLRILGTQTAAEAAAHWAMALSPLGGASFVPAAAKLTGASVGAFAAAGAVSAFGAGGDFTTNGPQLIMVGDNPGGRERVRIDPQPDSRGGGSTQVVMNGDVYGAGGADEFIQGVIKGIKKAERGRVA